MASQVGASSGHVDRVNMANAWGRSDQWDLGHLNGVN